MGAKLLEGGAAAGFTRLAPSFDASRASFSIRAKSLAANASFGVTQEPPTQTTLSSAR